MALLDPAARVGFCGLRFLRDSVKVLSESGYNWIMMKPANSRIKVAKLLLDRTEREGIRSYRYSDLQRMAYEITHGEGAWERDRASLGKEYASRFRGWYADQLTGGRHYHQGIVNFYFTKVSTPEGVRYVRNLTEHFDRPFRTMKQARRLDPVGTWHKSCL